MLKSKNSDRVEQVYLAIRMVIFEAAIEPGRRLPEDTIGEKCSVNRKVRARLHPFVRVQERS